jgi:hypothetical protein
MEIREIAVKQEPDETPDVSWLEPDSGRYDNVTPASVRETYRRQDAERLAAFNRDEWHMIGVYATVELDVKGTVQTIRSPGIWGIESDSNVDYLAVVGREQLEELAEIVRELVASSHPRGVTVPIVEEIRNAAPAPVEYV